MSPMAKMWGSSVRRSALHLCVLQAQVGGVRPASNRYEYAIEELLGFVDLVTLKPNANLLAFHVHLGHPGAQMDRLKRLLQLTRADTD